MGEARLVLNRIVSRRATEEEAADIALAQVAAELASYSEHIRVAAAVRLAHLAGETLSLSSNSEVDEAVELSPFQEMAFRGLSRLKDRAGLARSRAWRSSSND